MAVRFPTSEMTIYLAADEEWKSGWGITYILDRLLLYGNNINHIFTLGDSPSFLAAKKLAEDNKIFYMNILSPNEDTSWDGVIINNENHINQWRPPTHLLLLSNNILLDENLQEMINCGVEHRITTVRVMDYVNHYTMTVLNIDSQRDKMENIGYK